MYTFSKIIDKMTNNNKIHDSYKESGQILMAPIIANFNKTGRKRPRKVSVMGQLANRAQTRLSQIGKSKFSDIHISESKHLESMKYIHFLDSLSEFSRNESLKSISSYPKSLKSGSTERQNKVSFIQGNNLLVPGVDSPKQRRRSFTDFVRKLTPVPAMRKANVREFINV